MLNWNFRNRTIWSFNSVYLCYIIDASGGVISDVSFGFTRESGFCNIRPSRPNDPVSIDLTPTPIPAAKLHIFHTRQMITEMALSMGIFYPWCNGYRSRKWARQHEFKSWTRLIAFHIALIPLGKVWIQLFSPKQWVNSRTEWALQPLWGN